jgi:zinc transporter 1/2/3
MFENECLGELAYEGTASAILMAGLFLSFLVDYIGQRVARWHAAKKSASVEPGSPAISRSSELVNVAMLEAGIIFHSLRT